MGDPILKFFESEHLPYELRSSQNCASLAYIMHDELTDCAEKSAGMTG